MVISVDVLPDVAERAGWLGLGGSALGRVKKCEASRVQLACAWKTKVARVNLSFGFIGNDRVKTEFGLWRLVTYS